MKTKIYKTQMYKWAKRAIFLVLFCFIIIGSTLSQTETCIPIGNENIENNDYPFSGMMSQSYLQQIYTKAELSDQNFEAGDIIKSISFNYFWDTPTKRPIKIFIGNTSVKNLNTQWISHNVLTNVFTSDCQEFSKGSDNWTRINLSTNFTYTGENIVIAVLMNKGDTDEPTNCFTEAVNASRFYVHKSTNGISRYTKPGGNTPITFDENTGFPKTGNSKIPQNSRDIRTNIKLCKTSASCLKVTDINATDITYNTITLDWTNGGSESSWTIEYGETGFAQGKGQIIKATNHPFSVHDLDPTTSYDFYIRADCSEDNNSIWSSIKKLTTPCGIVSNPSYREEFKNNSPSLKCWTIIDANIPPSTSDQGNWEFKENQAKYSFNPSSKANAWLISPRFNLKEELSFSFEYKAPSTYISGNPTQEKFSVWIIKGNNPEDITNAVEILETQTINNHSYTAIPPISLKEYINQDIYIAIKCESEEDQDHLYIDNFKIYKPSSEKEITSFKLATETSSATIDNTNNKVDIVISFSTDKSALAPEIEVSELASINPASGETRNFNSPQEYVVRAENGSTKTWTVEVKNAETGSPENDILDFKFSNQIGNAKINKDLHTVEATIAWQQALTNIAPTIEISQFASISPASGTEVDFTNSPVTYTVKADNGNPQEWKVIIKKENTPAGTDCENALAINLSDQINPYILADETTKDFGDTYNNTSLGAYDDGQDKIYKLSVTEGSIYTIKLNTSTPHAAMALFKSCPSENKISKKTNSTHSPKELTLKDNLFIPNEEYYLMVDKNSRKPNFIESYKLTFAKNENPSCTSPTNLKVNNVLQTTAIVSWSQALGETEWELQYGNDSFNPKNDAGTIISNITSPTHNLVNLDENSEYRIFIRSKCTDTEKGKWEGPIKFKTLEACSRPTNLTINNITANSAEITWNGLDATNWVLEYKLASETDYQSLNLTETTHSLIGLNHSSKYTIRVKAKCEDDKESIYTEEQAIYTLCQNISDTPYLEDFENYGNEKADLFPRCWTRPVTYKDFSSEYPLIARDLGYMPTRCLKFASQTDEATIAATPIINIDLQDLILEFTLKKEEENSGSIIVGLMTDPNDKNTFSEILTFSPTNSNANHYKIIFKDHNITGGDKSIAFKHSTEEDGYFYWLDDVKIRKTHAGNDITSFSTPDLSEDIKTNKEKSEIKGTILLDKDLTKQIPTIKISEGAKISPESGVVTDFSNPVKYTVTAEDGTSKEWTVTLEKATTKSSEKEILDFKFAGQIGDATINTTLGTVSAKIDWKKSLYSISPKIEISNFASISPESEVAQNFNNPVKYKVTAENGSEKTWTVTIERSGYHAGSTCENPLSLDLSALENTYILTNETTKDFGNIYNESDLDEYDSDSQENKIYKLNVSERHSYSINLSSSSKNIKMSLFNGCPSEDNLIKTKNSGNNTNILSLDNLILNPNIDYYLMVEKIDYPTFIKSYDISFIRNENPPCISPDQLEISNILQTTAEITWTQALHETEWELQYGNIGINPDGGSGTIITENIKSPYTLTGLTPNHRYSVYIRSKCADSKKGEWFGPKEFTSLLTCPTPVNLNISEITTNSATISWDGFNTTNWTLEYKLSSEENFQHVDLTQKPYTLTGLKNSSSYTIRIKAKCEASDESLYSEEKTFETLCGIISEFPYLEEFTYKSTILNCWTIIDENNDETEWNLIGNYAEYTYHSTNNAADWLISPKLKLKENLELSFDYRNGNSSKTEKFSVWLIKGDSPYNHSDIIELIPSKEVNSDVFTTQTPISLQDYANHDIYIGIKCESDADMGTLRIDNFRVFTPSPENDILSFSVPGHDPATIDKENHEVNLNISYTTDVTALKPIITISDYATISPASGEAIDFSNPVTYTVKAENGDPQEWIVKAIKPTVASSEKEILSFTFPDQIGVATIDSENDIINAVAKWNQNLGSITPTIEISPYASIDPEGGIAQNFSSGSVIYKVKADDGSVKEWTVTITNDDTHICTSVFSTPFTETFSENSNTVNCWNIIDVDLNGNDNSGSGKWKIDLELGEVEYKWAYVGGNDWLVSPKIKLSSNNNLTFEYKTDKDFSEKFSVHLIRGNAFNTTQATELLETKKVKERNWTSIDPISLENYNELEVYIAIKCESDADKRFLKIKNLKISSNETDASSFTIKASVASGNGTISPSGNVSVPAGENKTFNFLPANGYILDKVLIDGNEPTTPIAENSYTFTNVQANHTIAVSFKKTTTPPAQTFTIKASVANGNGTINPSGNVSVPAGENKTFNFTPANGYILDKVLIDGNEPTTPIAGNSYTFTNVRANHTIVVKFRKTDSELFTIMAAVFEGNGTISPTYKTVTKGANVDFLITPNANYKLEKLMNNGVDKTEDVDNNKYTLHNIQDSHHIVVRFQLANNISEEFIIDINIYPNPTNDLLNIEVSDEISQIEIMSIDGKLLDKQNVNSNNYQYNTSRLSEGNYFVKIYTENKITIKQFSVKR